MTYTHFNKTAAKAAAMLSVAFVVLFAFAFFAAPVAHADDPSYGSYSGGADLSGGSSYGYDTGGYYGSNSGGADLSGGSNYGTYYGSNSGGADLSGGSSYGSYYGSSSGTADLSGNSSYGSYYAPTYGATDYSGCGSNCGGSSYYSSPSYSSGCGSNCGGYSYYPSTYSSGCTSCNSYTPTYNPPVNTECNTCNPNPPVNTPSLSVSCSVSGSTVNVGDTVVWYASVSGGNGNYSYSWNGTDGLSSGSQTVSKQYSTPGSKSGQVTVTSGNQTRTANCGTVTVQQPIVPLQISCMPNPSTVQVNNTVAWTAQVSGGNGSYTYSWSGTDGLSGSGQTVTKLYSTSGTKNGQVTVTSSDGQTQVANCGSVVVQQSNFSVSCSVSPMGSINVGSTVVWTANVSGDNSTGYTYSWSGTDGLYGTGPSVSQAYSIAGTKTGQVVVTSSDGRVQSANCGSVYVQQIYNSNPVSGSCSVLGGLYNIPTNTSVTWLANASGGDGNYTYSWTGTDGLYSNNSTATKYYTYSGSKNASVTIFSAGQQTTVNCGTIYVNDVYNQNVNVSCYANASVATVGQPIVWTANVNGNTYNNGYGNGYSYGGYTYTWTGTDGLYGSGPTVSQAYSIPGLKTAAVSVYGPNGQQFTQQCSNTVQVGGTSNVTVYRTPGSNQLSSAVYLSQVPYTGLADGWKVYLYLAGLVAFSSGVAWIMLRRTSKVQA